MPGQNTIPRYPSSHTTAHVSIATANTNRDGTGTVGTLYTAAATTAGGAGAKVRSISIKATGTTTAGMVRFFRHDGTNFFLIREIDIAAFTPSGTVKGAAITTTEGADVNGQLSVDWDLKPGDSIRCSTHNAETFHVTANVDVYDAT
jgi:hypothetical protein